MRSIDRHVEARDGCGHHHGLLFAKPGELAPGAKRRQWRVALGAFTAQAATWPWGEPLLLARGTRLRYDQRDYDNALRHDAWDRFCVLNGPDAGRCVFLSALMPDSPVAGGTSLIEPVDEEIVRGDGELARPAGLEPTTFRSAT